MAYPVPDRSGRNNKGQHDPKKVYQTHKPTSPKQEYPKWDHPGEGPGGNFGNFKKK